MEKNKKREKKFSSIWLTLPEAIEEFVCINEVFYERTNKYSRSLTGEKIFEYSKSTADNAHRSYLSLGKQFKVPLQITKYVFDEDS